MAEKIDSSGIQYSWQAVHKAAKRAYFFTQTVLTCGIHCHMMQRQMVWLGLKKDQTN